MVKSRTDVGFLGDAWGRAETMDQGMAIATTAAMAGLNCEIIRRNTVGVLWGE